MMLIKDIRVDGGTQSRAAINQDVVAEYAAALEDPTTVFPPVIIYNDGKSYWLADGFHRLDAFKQAGRTEIPADIRQGDRRRAILHSVQANANHGLRRTNADKRRAIITLLDDPEWVEWSDRAIAKQCRVDHKTVGRIREEYLGNSPDSRKVERGGTTFKQDTSNIGKSKQATEKQKKSKGDTQPPAAKDGKASSASFQSNRSEDGDKKKADPARKGLSGLTREGLEDEVAGLREETVELRQKVKSQKAEIEQLKASVKDLSSSEHGAIIGKLTKERDIARGRMSEYQAEAARLGRRIRFLEKERDEARSDLEMQEIPL